jgi:hypothetical protein
MPWTCAGARDTKETHTQKTHVAGANFGEEVMNSFKHSVGNRSSFRGTLQPPPPPAAAAAGGTDQSRRTVKERNRKNIATEDHAPPPAAARRRRRTSLAPLASIFDTFNSLAQFDVSALFLVSISFKNCCVTAMHFGGPHVRLTLKSSCDAECVT